MVQLTICIRVLWVCFVHLYGSVYQVLGEVKVGDDVVAIETLRDVSHGGGG